MRILIIKSGLEIGGTTTSFLNFLSRLKHLKDVKTDIWIKDEKRSAIQKYISDKIEIIESRDLELGFADNRSRIGKLVEAIRLGTLIDILLGRLCRKKREKLIPYTQKYMIKRAKSKPRINLMEYDAVISWEEMYPCYYLAYAVQAKRKIGWIHPDYQQCGFNPRLDREAFKMLDAVVCVSESNKENIQKVFPQYRKKFYSVPNCIDSDMIFKLRTHIPDDIPQKKGVTLITVARMQNVSKAIDRALRIVATLKARNCVFRWLFIGGGEDLENLKRMAGQLEITDYVFFLGPKDNPYGYINNADVLVLQSHYEGWPMVVDEAKQLGVPVLVTNYASAKEQVPEQAGWIVENTEADITDAIEKIVNHPNLIKVKKSELNKYLIEGGNEINEFERKIKAVLK